MGRYGSRKLVVCLIGMGIAAWLRSRGLIDSADCVSVLVAGMLGYPAANVAQRALEGKGTP